MANIRKNALIATIAIFGSRIFGLVREQVLAMFFGAGAALDAFVVAFRIPNLLRDLFAEGALSQAFVAIFSKNLQTGDIKDAHKLANQVATLIILVVGLLVIIGMIFAPQLVTLIAPDYTATDKQHLFNLTVRLLRIMFPFILLVSLSALKMGMLQAHNKFFIPHSASTFFNIVSITAGIGFAYWFSQDYILQTIKAVQSGQTLTTQDWLNASNAIAGMSFGVLSGGLAQLLIQFPVSWKLKYRPKLNFDLFNPQVKRVIALTIPAVIGGAAVQVNVMVNTIFATSLVEGSVSWLNYAFRFMQFPLGVFGVAIASASAPVLAKLVATQEMNRFRSTIQNSIRMSLFLTVPSAVGLYILGPEIISLIYERGRFTPESTYQTALALKAYGLGIIGYALIKIYQPAFLAFDNSKTPMKISFLSIFFNLILNSTFILVLELDHWALALSTSLVALINLILLSILFRKNLNQIWTKSVFVHLLKIILATVAMAMSIIYFKEYIHQIWNQTGIIHKLANALLPIAGGIAIYFFSTALLGVDEMKALKKRLKRR